jgi:mannose/fructose/N-acetylgalactosamine-specific phosphotransferase system component IID
VHKTTPAHMPSTNLPKHMDQKLRYNAITEAIMPIILNLMITYLLPYLIKSPAKIDPIDTPTIVLVVKIVPYRSIY